MMPRTAADERYHTDSQFRMMVDVLESWIHQMDATPSEVRDMAMLACFHYEMRRARSFCFNIEGDMITPMSEEARALVHDTADRIEAVRRWMELNPLDESGR